MLLAPFSVRLRLEDLASKTLAEVDSHELFTAALYEEPEIRINYLKIALLTIPQKTCAQFIAPTRLQSGYLDY